MRKAKFDILFPCMLALATLAISSCQPTGGKGNDGQKGDNGEEVLFLTDSVHVSKNIDSIMSIDYDFQFLKPGNTVADSINAGINRLCISGSHDADVCTAISTAIDKEVNEMKKTMKIKGMMCGHCEARVKKCLEEIPGVIEADVSYKKNRAVVTLSEEVSDEILKNTIEAQGYSVLEIK